MEDELYSARAALRCLLQTHPTWTQHELAEAVGRSVSWVKKWVRRLRAAAPDDPWVLQSRSRARVHPPAAIAPGVVESILDIRDQPPEDLRRVPGPKAILYYLQRDRVLQETGAVLPRSTRTVWRILVRNARIIHTTRPDHEPVERPAPMTAWQLDYKDVSTVPAEPDGKRGHVVEVLNTLDVGTSVLLAAQVRDDFTTETSLQAVAEVVRAQGLPDQITFDRDPRFVGSVRARDFPAPFVRFWACLGVGVTICPPHRPDKNAFVERYHRSDTEECLRRERPTTVDAVREVTAAYKEHYNFQRPNQALSCGNQPPRSAYPLLPARPSVPLVVDPDAWVRTIDGRSYVRRVQDSGNVTIGEASYYAGRALAGHTVVLRVDATTRQFVVVHQGEERSRVPIKGLVQRLVSFDTFVDLLAAQARGDRAAHLPTAS